MIPYSEREQKLLVERLCSDIVVASSNRYAAAEREEAPAILPSLQLLLDLDFEQRFDSLMRSIYHRLPLL